MAVVESYPDIKSGQSSWRSKMSLPGRKTASPSRVATTSGPFRPTTPRLRPFLAAGGKRCSIRNRRKWRHSRSRRKSRKFRRSISKPRRNAGAASRILSNDWGAIVARCLAITRWASHARSAPRFLSRLLRCLALVVSAAAAPNYPELTGRVTDETGLLSAADKADIESQLRSSRANLDRPARRRDR